jgi:protein TonB
MNPRKLTALLAIAALAASGGCTRDKPAPPARAGEAGAPAPDLPIDTMPKVLDAAVKYPEEARARGEQGVVQVKALVGKDGKVTDVSVDPAQTASPVLVQAALEAVRQWTFEPARSGGEPIAVWIVVPVAFRLN